MVDGDAIPLNRVRANDLQQELRREFGKREWREAIASAERRWLLEGHRVERVSTTGTTRRTGWYLE